MTVSPFISRPPANARRVFITENDAPPADLWPGSLIATLIPHYAQAGGGRRGRLPLPEKQAVQDWLAEAGIDNQTPIVVYDAGNGSQAARAWWVLNWAGHNNVFILAEGSEAAQPPGQTATFREVTTDDILRHADDVQLVDARGTAAFEEGHLPGAISLPVATFQDGPGRLLPRAQRQAKLAALGLTDSRPLVAYCGSGIASAWLVAALHDAGLDAALYVGSWSAWSQRDA